MLKIGLPIYSGEKRTAINTAYINYIIAAGMSPVSIFVNEPIDEKIKMCDGLLLPGGIDIDPTYYGQNNVGSFAVDPKRDIFERLLLHSFIQAEKPVFGICRGFQLIVRELVCGKCKGFYFYQDLGGHSQSAKQLERNIRLHDVLYNPEDLYGGNSDDTSRMFVNSFHHQAFVMGLKTRNRGVIETEDYDIRITAITKYNITNNIAAIIEGIKIPQLGVSGVQWHPEELSDIALIQHAFGENNEQEADNRVQHRSS